jgi:hypothetical protein
VRIENNRATAGCGTAARPKTHRECRARDHHTNDKCGGERKYKSQRRTDRQHQHASRARKSAQCGGSEVGGVRGHGWTTPLVQYGPPVSAINAAPLRRVPFINGGAIISR